MKANWNKVSEYRNELFGIAAVLVLLVHSKMFVWSSQFGKLTLKIFEQGSVGVDIFLFLSGMGLYHSLKTDNNIKRFYQKRLKRVVIPYLLIAVPGYAIYDLILGNDTVNMFLLDISLLGFWLYGRSVTWYISFIMVMYLIYPVIYYVLLEGKGAERRFAIAFFLVLILNAVLFYWQSGLYNILEAAYTRIPVFMLGAWGGRWIYEKKPLPVWKSIGALGIYAIIRGVLICSGDVLSDEAYVLIIRISYMFGALSIIMLGPFILEKMSGRHFRRILKWFGEVSLEIYLTHCFLIGIYLATSVGKQHKSVWIYFVFIIPLALLISTGYKYIKNFIYRKLSGC